jgi:hypothetical protein
MTDILLDKPFSAEDPVSRWSLHRLLRAFLRTRREVHRISVLSRRERLQRGYRHIPRRLWDRRSALFIERRRALCKESTA